MYKIGFGLRGILILTVVNSHRDGYVRKKNPFDASFCRSIMSYSVVVKKIVMPRASYVRNNIPSQVKQQQTTTQAVSRMKKKKKTWLTTQ